MTIIAQHQLDKPDEFGLTLDQLFIEAKDRMLVYAQKPLKEYLSEARDHKVIIEKEESDGKTHIYMNYPRAILEKLIQKEL